MLAMPSDKAYKATQNVDTSGLTVHDALSDCIMTQRLISNLLLNGYEL